VSGIYPEDQRSWWAAPPSLVVDEPLDPADGHGFSVEPAHQAVARSAAMLPWTSALAHKAAMTRSPQIASFSALTRDRSGGTITIDGRGACVPAYAVTDERDVALLRRALHELIRLHDAAGAKYIFATARNEVVRWRRGDSLNGFVEYLCAVPFGANGHALHSVHQMSTARMGRDPRDSVAQPTGELHDLRGVWIGDTSAFPTALGVHPMVACMALAARTAEHIAAALR
jgi:choline dehydrogenase-like flavoprotein